MVYLYSQKFANGIMYFLKMYVKEHDGLSVVPPTLLNFSHYVPSDFIVQPYVNILHQRFSLQAWLKTRLNYNAPSVLSKITNKEVELVNPYIYMDC